MTGQVGENRSPITWLIISMCTFGIGYLIWLNKVYNDANKYTDKDVSPIVWGLLILCIPFVGGLLCYMKMAELLEDMQKISNIEAPEKTLLMILGLFVPIVNVFLVQDYLNKVWEAGAGAPGIH